MRGSRSWTRRLPSRTSSSSSGWGLRPEVLLLRTRARVTGASEGWPPPWTHSSSRGLFIGG
jgi:hypothetical protein